MEKCMMTASVAFLLCHPNSSINCSNPCKQHKKLNKSIQENPTRKPTPVVQLKPHKCQLATTTRLSVVYDHLESTQYPSIQALDRILRRGWIPNKQGCSRLVIDKVLKVNHKDGFVDKFDKYREIIKGKASTDDIAVGGVDKKLREDGFELLSFIGTKLACLPRLMAEGGVHSVCRKRYCGVCRLIRIIETSSLERLRSLSVSENVWMAHQKAIKECGDDQLGCCRKAVVICRVVAGRIADHRRWSSVDTGEREPDHEFDSVFIPVTRASDSHDDLLVFNPSAILPCFVILYNVQDS